MAAIQNIIFDLDGTLWDSRKEIIEAWKQVIPNLDITADDLTHLMGCPSEEFLKFLFPNVSYQEASRLMNQCEQAEVKYLTKNGTTLFPNAIEVLNALAKNYHLYIVSNCQKGYIESFLNHYQVSHLFDDFESSGNTNLDKSQNIQILLERNHIRPEQCCYVGDTLKDLEAAKQNHMLFVWAAYGFEKGIQTDYSIQSLNDLSPFLSSIR